MAESWPRPSRAAVLALVAGLGLAVLAGFLMILITFWV